MVPLVIVAVILLCFVKEKPLATTIERDGMPENVEMDGATNVRLDGGNTAAADCVPERGASARGLVG